MTGRALVLGGGGVTGVAWEIGVLAGLAAAGTDLTDADLVVGTSAGSAVGAQVTSDLPLTELYNRQLAGYGAEIPARMGPRTLAAYVWAMLRTRDPQRFRARLGAMALAADTVTEAERRVAIADRVPVHAWPERRLVITAVDARTGEFLVFDRDSEVPLVDAVAASCAVPGVWPPVSIDGHQYIDGGMRSPVNADLAAGCDRIVVLAPVTGGGGPIPSVARQVAALREGARVAVVSPDAAARKAMGRNSLDPAYRPAAARAGYAQAATQVATVSAVWAD
jgi:NTE family protein